MEEENNCYTETLLYVVHVAETDAMSKTDGQESSRRTTASFNRPPAEQTPTKSALPLISFSNPFRRLNNLLRANHKSLQSPSTPHINATPLCSSTAKKLSFVLPDPPKRQLFPPPPPEFLSDHSIRLHSSAPRDGLIDQQYHVDLKASEHELRKLVVAIDGPSKADIQIETIGTGIYRVHYQCSLPGTYHLSITYDDVHIDGSPFPFSLRTEPGWRDARAQVEPREFYLNSPCLVQVRPERPCRVFQAYIQASNETTNLPVIVHKSAKSENYEIYFIPRRCVDHWLHVHLNNQPMKENPCRLVVRPRSLLRGAVKNEEEVFHAHTGELSQFFVSKSPSDREAKKGDFSVSINGPATVSLHVNETDYGYEFHYEPPRTGRYSIAVKHDGKHIAGSPFLCRVDGPPLTVNASKVCVFGTGLYEAKKRRKARFKIDASQAGPGLLLVGLHPCERLVVKCSSKSALVSEVSYRVRTAGHYPLTILYGPTMQHVPGSPYLVLVE